jgi:hypothetical protein
MNVLISTNVLKFQCKFPSIGEEDLVKVAPKYFHVER